MTIKTKTTLAAVLSLACLASCESESQGVQSMPQTGDTNYGIAATAEILLTSEAGDKIATTENVSFKDEQFDLLPMIKEALDIKSAQTDNELRIVASAWTAPPWMKDIEVWFIKGSPENNYQGTGGVLKKQYVQTYADYIAKYLQAYREEGVDI